MKPELVIWGAGGHALVVADIVRCAGKFHIAGFLDDVNPTPRDFAGAMVIGRVSELPAFAPNRARTLLPGIGDNAARLRMIDTAARTGFELATAAHPSSVIAADVMLGAGTVAAAGVIVNPGAIIGRVVILNTACSIDHHCEIADGAHIAPGARLAGSVRVGRGAWIGIGAVIRENISIGENAVVGAGAVVVRDVPPGVIVAGNPARILKDKSRAST